MKHRIIQFLVTVSMLSLSLSSVAVSADNQFLDDHWRRQAGERSKSPPSPPAPTTRAMPQAVVPASAAQQGQLIPAVVGLPPVPSVQQSYRIGPNDVIRIQVFQVEELNSEERVSETGQIVMPLIGTLKVAGMTPQEAGAHIAAILRKDYIQNPQVDVYVKEAVSQQITVMGSVVKPGVFPISGQTTLLQAIALAQGVTPLAKESEVILFRKDGSGTPVAYVVDVGAVQKGELTDPVLIGDDRIVVPQSGTRVFIKGVADTLRGFVRPLGGY